MPAALEVRAGGRSIGGRIGYREKGMLSTGSGRGTNDRPLGEVFEPGAFDFSIRQAVDMSTSHDIHLLAAHDTRAPLASVKAGSLKFKDGKRQMDFEADLVNTRAADDVLELIAKRVAVGVSFGFMLPPERRSPNAIEMKREPFELGEGEDAVRFDPEPDVPGADVRVIRDVLLFEVSVGVTRPVYKANTARLRAEGYLWDVPAPKKSRRSIWLP
ncbi:MAG: hypothetical protein HC871_08760 [Rhizobiales bacterium]|nr:hypothetical protein [Hyphomicrobiales bacterium]